MTYFPFGTYGVPNGGTMSLLDPSFAPTGTGTGTGGDDSAAIVNAITWLNAATGRALFVPPATSGTYNYNQTTNGPITLTGGYATIFGAGEFGAMFTFTGTTGNGLVLSGTHQGLINFELTSTTMLATQYLLDVAVVSGGGQFVLSGIFLNGGTGLTGANGVLFAVPTGGQFQVINFNVANCTAGVTFTADSPVQFLDSRIVACTNGVVLPASSSITAASPKVFQDCVFGSNTTNVSFASAANTYGGKVLFRNNTGLNPVGVQVSPGIPTSTTVTTNPFPYDVEVYMVAGASTVTVAIGGTTAFVVPANAAITFTVPWNQTYTLTYSTTPSTLNYVGF